ncbi:MAG: hypothetical protein OXI48_03435 [bacterium]|nr:hypothetical protein [bacterium]
MPGVAAPVLAETLAARDVAVGASLDVDVAAGFSGTVDSYTASSDDTAVLEASAAGSLLTLKGVAVGSATVAVTALNSAGSASQSFQVTVLDSLRLVLSAPSHCLGSEGRVVGDTREGVGAIRITYTVAGGTEPYAVTSPDASGTHSAASGTLTVSCARSGIDLSNVAPNTNVVESGPKTVKVTAVDAAGANITHEATVTVAEHVETRRTPSVVATDRP